MLKDIEEIMIDLIEGKQPTGKISRKVLIEIIQSIYGKYLNAKILLGIEMDNLKEVNQGLSQEHETSLSLIFQLESLIMKNEYNNKELKKLNRKLDRINKVDHLTKVFNRRTWLEYAENELNRTKRNIDSLKKSGMFEKVRNICSFTVAFLDIDNFKKVNDNYGHAIGDRVLREIGKLLISKGLFRKTDVAGRYGGEEFILLFPNLSAVNSEIVINKLLERVRKIKIPDGKNGTFGITLSVGVSDFNFMDQSVQDVINRADEKMYAAKFAGKDKIVI